MRASGKRALDEQGQPDHENDQREARHGPALPAGAPEKEETRQADRHQQGLAHLDALSLIHI